MLGNCRKSGVLLHITSLPSLNGWGKFSKECYDFIDLLKIGGFSVWEVLPFSPPLLENSPYSTYSSFAINPNFLDVSQYLTESELSSFALSSCSNLSEYSSKMQKVIKLVCEKERDKHDLTKFVRDNKYWLEDFAMFCVAKEIYKSPWYRFPEKLRNRQKSYLEKFKKDYKKEIEDVILIQYLLDHKWKDIKAYANKQGVKIFGDAPFYVELDSADVWANKNSWKLENDKPKLVAGVPPDYFNSDGQLWGYPIYDYDYLEKNNYEYFVKKFKRLSKLYDIVRLDHFVAFNKYYAIPSNHKNAKRGKWYNGAKEKLLKKIIDSASCEIVAEDLGIVTDDVIKLKNKFYTPGIKVLLFAFDNDSDNMYKPHNYEKNCVAYIGTHDNDTLMGLLSTGCWDKINRFKRYFQMPLERGNEEVVNNAIINLYRSSANTVIFTMQDLLKLGSEARMNVPGKAKGNWEWKLKNFPDESFFSKFCELSDLYARNN